MAYLVCKSQKEIIEEDGGGRNCIILVAIARSQSQKRRKLMLTLNAVLEISGSEGWESLLMNGVKGRGSQIIADVDNLLQSVGRHRNGVRERESLLMKQFGAASSLKRDS